MMSEYLPDTNFQKKILVLSDNEAMLHSVNSIIHSTPEAVNASFDFKRSPGGLVELELSGVPLEIVDLKTNLDDILDQHYSLILSAHCKQIFPQELVEKVTCINIHPGLNPYNRGMFPQVFSIINGLPAGATLHIMDDKVDHGPIIDQEEVSMQADDTSGTLYERVLQAEEAILRRNMGRLILGTYSTHSPASEGNINTMKDFENLKEIDLQTEGTFESHLNLLRALTHDTYKNAYFINPASGKRVWVRVDLEEEA